MGVGEVKFIRKIAVIAIGLLCVSVPTFASTKNIEMYLNGEFVELEDNSIYIEAGNTMVPLRFIAESTGATVEYDQLTKKILIKKDDRSIELVINSPKVLINNAEMELSAKPEIKENITMVPLRFVSEALEVYINYNAKNKTIYLSTLQYNVPDNLVTGYMLAIDSVYNKDIALNNNITYVAIDTTRMRYLSEDSKQNLLKEMERYGVVIEATYEELKEQGLIKDREFTKGILITIDDLRSDGDQLILDIDKWKASLGAIGCMGMVLEEDEAGWKITEKGMWLIS